MTRNRQPPPSAAASPARLLLALLLAGGLILLATLATFLLVTGRSPLALATQPTAAREVAAAPPPREPTLSAGVVREATATPSPAAPTATARKPAPGPAPLQLPTQTPTPTPASLRAVVNAAVVNIRSGPGAAYAVVGQVSLGQPFDVVTRTAQNDWLEICCPLQPGQTVWISAEFMALLGAVEIVPVARILPTPEAIAPPPMAPPGVSAADPASSLAHPAAGIPGSGGFAPPGEINPLTGFPLPANQRSRRPLIICLNNDYAARPQYGTDRADVVYEYLMEGYSITRFSAVYYGEESEQIGPIRSARLVNLALGALYDAGLACSGASDPVRFSLKNDVPFPYLDIDLDDPSNRRYTVSIGSDYRTRLRTSTAGLRRWLADWGAERAASLRGFTFGDLPPGGAPASTVSIPYPAATGSQVTYRYDPGSGRYLRFLGGAPHLDGNSGAQLALDTLLVQYVPHETTAIVEDSLGSKSIRLNLFGSGKALLFRNGVGFEGAWRSESQGDMPHFLNGQGQEIPLKPGKSWISIVPLTYAIAYQ